MHKLFCFSKIMVNIIFVIFLFFLFLPTVINGTHLTNKIFKWKHYEPTEYTSGGNHLSGHSFLVANTKSVLICAYQCLRLNRCLSFNYNKASGSCVLNHKDHTTEQLTSTEPDGSYHARNEFTIDPEALGPCAGYVCNNNGRCLETKTKDDQLIAVCVCRRGWSGKICKESDPITWGMWQNWKACSVSCEHGYRQRVRYCEDTDKHQTLVATKCEGRHIQHEACHMTPCPRWDPWGVWSECSTDQTCGRGFKTRHRTCNNGGTPKVDRYCLGLTNQTSFCESVDCMGPIRLRGGTVYGEGRVEVYNEQSREWAMICSDQWSLHAADMVCKQLGMPGAFAHITDTRFGYGEGQYGVTSLTCSGDERALRTCKRNPWSLNPRCGGITSPAGVQCRVNGVWALWEEWGECSVSCEDGIRQRTRTCSHRPALHGGRDCAGEKLQTKPCTLNMCPVDGEWKSWNGWSECSTTCGPGTQQRSRSCSGPFYNGQDCQGGNSQTQDCQIRMCPVDGVWNGWGDWNDCSKSCGHGSRFRTRICHGPFYDGAACPGSETQSEGCNQFECPADGVWQDWNAWSDCSRSCGTGMKARSRTCNGPFYGGKDCEGLIEEDSFCNTHSCPVDGIWMDWSKWGQCSQTCAGGTQWRNRNCIGPFHGGEECQGPQDMSQSCNEHHCPIDGVWTSWGDWSGCNATCGGGVVKRERTCKPPQFGGADCSGDSTDFKACNTNPCPIPGAWAVWAVWSGCSLTCGGGKKSRSRVCNMTSYGDLTAPCEGPDNEIVDCHTFPCVPRARTCSEWGVRGLSVNTMADIDPDLAGGTLDPVRVYCDMTSEDGVGITIIGHDSLEEEEVKGYEGAGDYFQEIVYNVSLNHVNAVVDASAECRQFIKWRCLAALIHNNQNGGWITGWRNRNGDIADYFGDAPPGSGMCTCGVMNECADDEELACNCDKNDDVWREDSGYLSHKEDLPVTEFLAGDTGGVNEGGYRTIGPLFCSGVG